MNSYFLSPPERYFPKCHVILFQQKLKGLSLRIPRISQEPDSFKERIVHYNSAARKSSDFELMNLFAVSSLLRREHVDKAVSQETEVKNNRAICAVVFKRSLKLRAAGSFSFQGVQFRSRQAACCGANTYIRQFRKKLKVKTAAPSVRLFLNVP